MKYLCESLIDYFLTQDDEGVTGRSEPLVRSELLWMLDIKENDWITMERACLCQPIRGRGRRALPLSSCEYVTNGRRLQSSATSEVHAIIHITRLSVLFSVVVATVNRNGIIHTNRSTYFSTVQPFLLKKKSWTKVATL